MAPVKQNPYSPPVSVRVGGRGSAGAARALSGLVFACAALGGSRAVLYLIAAYRGDWWNRAGLPLVRGLAWSWEAYRLLFVAAVLLFSVWIYRANCDARALGAELRFRPGWAVAVSFLPIVNLIAPYRAVKEIHVGVATETSSPHPLVGIWWTVWILSLAWLPLSGPVLGQGTEMLRQSVGEGLRALSAVLLLFVVRQIENRQERWASTVPPFVPGSSTATPEAVN
jgi:Domain of unknown function (DUF4328)